MNKDDIDDEGQDNGGTTVDMDQISAHLDRGWDLIQKGDYGRAELAARQVLSLDEESPEGYTLLGAVAAGQGDTDAALEHFEKAMALDPEFVDPILYAAETQLWPLENFPDALRLCEQALDVAEEEDEYIDALLLKAEAELALDDEEAAKASLRELPPTDYPDSQYHLRAGRLWFDLHDLAAAERELKKALEGSPGLPDALHALALVAEERGDFKEMVRLYLRVREADLTLASPPWGVSEERFEQLAEAALGELPDGIRKLLENVPILASDYPALEIVAEGNDPRMMGFFSGVPYPEKGTMSGAVPHLDCVFLYRRNIERICRNQTELEDEIRKTLFHETGHFFGLNEEQLEEMGLG